MNATTPCRRCCPRSASSPANLSQQLSVLRRTGLVTAKREGLSVSYTLTSPRVAELLAVARAILTGVVAGQVELLEDLPAVIGEATG